jgi:hypothetical protein
MFVFCETPQAGGWQTYLKMPCATPFGLLNYL